MIKNILITMRPIQWTKNIIIFVPLIFSRNLFNPKMTPETIGTFIIFCLLSSAAYIINDLIDLKKDREHPIKSKRPLASRRITKSTAVIVLLLLLSVSLPSAFWLNQFLGYTVVAYLLLQLAYSFLLKSIVILDVFSITAGFVLRVAAGGWVISVPISSWLIICTILLSLFLSLSKRRHELVTLGENASVHRDVLGEYNPYLLDQMISVVTASTVIAYALYTKAPETIEKFGGGMIYTIPFVLYGVFRYLYLIHQKEEGGNPEKILVKDKPLILNILFYVLVVLIILYFK